MKWSLNFWYRTYDKEVRTYSEPVKFNWEEEHTYFDEAFESLLNHIKPIEKDLDERGIAYNVTTRDAHIIENRNT